ncbi:MAG: hypothetical protein A2Z34_10685 [Planctomycetes bacterium RBG_16_59_8]|nr:MAG: hypothetical protein A2Z34_10685 [Planctomycetes bacterium RBG_16_59_8]
MPYRDRMVNTLYIEYAFKRDEKKVVGSRIEFSLNEKGKLDTTRSFGNVALVASGYKVGSAVTVLFNGPGEEEFYAVRNQDMTFIYVLCALAFPAVLLLIVATLQAVKGLGVAYYIILGVITVFGLAGILAVETNGPGGEYFRRIRSYEIIFALFGSVILCILANRMEESSVAVLSFLARRTKGFMDAFYLCGVGWLSWYLYGADETLPLWFSILFLFYYAFLSEVVGNLVLLHGDRRRDAQLRLPDNAAL